MTRTFEAVEAKRERVPLLIGLMGPSGGGKTFSALRLATGIQRITGGDIYVVDTESSRAKHYADDFKFKHVPFAAPFGSVDYLEALRFCAKSGAGVIVVDSMSHEHEGEGGYLDTHAREVERMSGGDAGKAERVKMAGWIKPAAARRRMINGVLQINANFIFCFRAKEKTKPKQGGGIQELGFMPIAGEEMLFEMTLNCLLPPKAGGVPQWRSDFVGERLMMKLPRQFENLFAEGRPLDEAHGQALAEWARGTKTAGAPIREDGAGTGTPAQTPAPKRTAADWFDDAAAEVVKCKTRKDLDAWLKANEAKLEKLMQQRADLANRLQDIISEQADSFNILTTG